MTAAKRKTKDPLETQMEGLRYRALLPIARKLGVPYKVHRARGAAKPLKSYRVMENIVAWASKTPANRDSAREEIRKAVRAAEETGDILEKDFVRKTEVARLAEDAAMDAHRVNYVDEAMQKATDIATKAALAAKEQARKIAQKTVKTEIDKRRQIEIVFVDPGKKGKGRIVKRKKPKGVFPEEFHRILQLAQSRKNILLVGPTGCGKSFIAEKLAEVMELPFGSASCTGGMSESQLTGWLVPGKGGEFRYKIAPFVKAYRDGGVFLLDEIDAADPNTITLLNAALSNGHFFVPHYPKDGGRIKRHKDFICIAAANTWGQGADMMYVGRNQLDAATLERFKSGRIFMDYSSAVEDSLVDAKILEWGRACRASIRENQFRRCVSTRFMLDLTDMKKQHKWKLADWETQLFADFTEDELEVVRPEGRKGINAPAIEETVDAPESEVL